LKLLVTGSPITNKSYEKMDQGWNAEKTTYHRSWKTTLYAILAVQGFGLAIACILFGAIVGSQPPSTYPVFGYGKPPPIVIEGFSSYYWAIPFAIAGFVFSYLGRKSRPHYHVVVVVIQTRVKPNIVSTVVQRCPLKIELLII
jgi:hypothetical protein